MHVNLRVLGKKKQGLAFLALQLVLVGLMYPFMEYGPDALPKPPRNRSHPALSTNTGDATYARTIPNDGPNPFYPTYQDVHVMVFVGFGFLMAFLKRYGQSSLGLTFLLGGFFTQLALFAEGFAAIASDNTNGTAKISLSLESFFAADTAVAAVLISFGAVIGKTSFFQLIVMGTVEIAAYTLNRHLCLRVLKAIDTGGSIVVHLFGAYFGLAASYASYGRTRSTNSKRKVRRLDSSYNSDIFAMIGTLVLWLYWPSFNSAGLSRDLQTRAIINTMISMCTSCVLSFACSLLLSDNDKFLMTHVQNASLAGGVAIGTVTGLMIGPFEAALVGSLGGIVSVLGYHGLQPYLTRRCKITDTCGVHNVHGLPSWIAAFYSAGLAYTASISDYSYSLYELFPARAPSPGHELDLVNAAHLLDIPAGESRSAGSQALHQMASLALTFAMSITSGLFAGALMRIPFFGSVPDDQLYEDSVIFDLPSGAEDPDIDTSRIKEDRRESSLENSAVQSTRF
ncbi:ammonium transporter Rh type B-B [Copidosoma floridanum]|uniref:ammonium transporter Rh type B-B n=1 Tax=Copidosoma floridanum TaxID=29053 RepID=UPI0006C9CEF7|nr:ammonium transporter Rh type B-B [Copidosoma floridanum]